VHSKTYQEDDLSLTPGSTFVTHKPTTSFYEPPIIPEKMADSIVSVNNAKVKFSLKKFFSEKKTDSVFLDDLGECESYDNNNNNDNNTNDNNNNDYNNSYNKSFIVEQKEINFKESKKLLSNFEYKEMISVKKYSSSNNIFDNNNNNSNNNSNNNNNNNNNSNNNII
jgi:hypothetical protein